MGLFIDIYIFYAARICIRVIKLLMSCSWPLTTATVLSTESEGGGGAGCSVATVHYEYMVDTQKYSDYFEKPFILLSSAEHFAHTIRKGTTLSVRTKPGNASVSIPCLSYLHP
jgi:hypothetical protein